MIIDLIKKLFFCSISLTGSQRSSVTRGEHLVRKQFRGKLWVSRNRYCHWKDKYTRIVSSLIETFLFVVLLIFLQWAIQMVYKQVFRKQRSIFTDFIWSFLDVFSCSFEFSFFLLIGIMIMNYKLPLFRIVFWLILPYQILTRYATHTYRKLQSWADFSTSSAAFCSLLSECRVSIIRFYNEIFICVSLRSEMFDLINIHILDYPDYFM